MDYLTKFYIKQKLRAPIHWFKHRFIKKHKYNVIYTGLKPGYYDCDIRIVYGVFKPFEEFMEFQLSPHSHIKWYFTDEEIEKELEHVSDEDKDFHRNGFIHKNAIWKELLTIYSWWRYDYQRLQEECWKPGKKDPLAEEEALEKELNKKMKRIIELRNYLWD